MERCSESALHPMMCVRCKGAPVGVSATCGAVTFIEPPQDVDCAVRVADELMHSGKVAGRAHCCKQRGPHPTHPTARSSYLTTIARAVWMPSASDSEKMSTVDPEPSSAAPSTYEMRVSLAV